jgi:hypothetical protein
MDQELKNLIKELIDDPKVRQQREASYKEALKFAKNDKERLELKLKEIRELRVSIPLYTKDATLRKKRIQIVEKQIDTTENLIKAEDRQTEIVGKLSKSFIGLGKAAFEGQGSISAFTDNIVGLKTIGNRLDVNIETFRQLSQTGANFGKSIVDLRIAAADAALPLDDFASLVSNNSKNLAALFGSTTQGAKEIASLGRQVREVGIDRLAPLGLTVDEINETLLLNLEGQRRTGVLDQLTNAQRRDSAIEFAEELDRLAKLTGAQRQELRSAIESQKANERFQVALQGQTEETRRRLVGFAGSIETISPALAEGFQDLIATAGAPVTESAIELVQNIPQARGVIQDLISGVITSEQALTRIRDISSASIGRFDQATITGTVGFTRLQGPLLELARRVNDSGAVIDEQNKSATSLVSNLTTFEQATKVLSSQFQGIETALLQSFGPALGGLVGGIQGAFGAGGGVAKALAGAPGLTATLIGGALIGKVLFGPAMQILTTAKGVAMGIKMSGGGGMFGGMSKGAIGPNMPGKGGRFGAFARTGVGRGVGAVGLGMNALGAYSSLSDDDKTNDASGYGTIAGTALGGLLGLVGGPAGAMLGASLGGMAGGAIGGLFGGPKALGGGMDEGKTYLTGERGPELVTAGTKSTVTTNNDLMRTFDTSALESKMATMNMELGNANKALANMVNGVNTLVAVESRALKAVEKTARKDVNQIGMV